MPSILRSTWSLPPGTQARRLFADGRGARRSLRPQTPAVSAETAFVFHQSQQCCRFADHWQVPSRPSSRTATGLTKSAVSLVHEMSLQDLLGTGIPGPNRAELQPDGCVNGEQAASLIRGSSLGLLSRSCALAACDQHGGPVLGFGQQRREFSRKKKPLTCESSRQWSQEQQRPISPARAGPLRRRPVRCKMDGVNALFRRSTGC